MITCRSFLPLLRTIRGRQLLESSDRFYSTVSVAIRNFDVHGSFIRTVNRVHREAQLRLAEHDRSHRSAVHSLIDTIQRRFKSSVVRLRDVQNKAEFNGPYFQSTLPVTGYILS